MEKNKLIIPNSYSIRDAIKKMDEFGKGFIFVENNSGFVVSLVTDGDFRRAILHEIGLHENVSLIANSNFIRISPVDSDKIVINKFLEYNIDFLPVVKNGIIVDVKYKEDYDLEERLLLPEKEFDIPVVIMAGGKGTRMAPFTHILPKPLIPIGEKSMLEVIMNEYNKFGFNNFFLTINYKGRLIKAYFEDIDHDYKLTYVEEGKFLGTAGSLKLININRETPIFVSNCDILIKDDYFKILEFHNSGEYDLTIVAAMIHHKVPYGVCKLKEGGELEELAEKPEYDYLVNSGMYIVNSTSLELIPDDEFFHITDLMSILKEKGGKVGVYPVSEKSWVDVGQWDEYNAALKQNNLKG